MGRIVVTEYISVDGVVEAPSGTETFERVGWTDDFSRGPEGDAFKFEETMASDALLLGRVTYDGFAPVAARRGRVRRQVQRDAEVRRVLDAEPRLEQHDRARGDVADEVAKLKERHERDVVVHGSRSSCRR
jgi:dihydrofolate reductase